MKLPMKLVEVRMMTKMETDHEGWAHPTVVMVFEDGTRVYPSRDPEGNGGGALFCIWPDGKDGYFSAVKESVA